jgi:hypothetical protein
MNKPVKRTPIGTKLDQLPDDATLVAVNDRLKLYSIPSLGKDGGAIDNGRAITFVNVQSALLRGYWTPPKNDEKYDVTKVRKVRLEDE